MTNRERVLALIRAEPGLTDTEIRKRTDVEPHQQVNQICRSFAEAGLTVRVTGPGGRIVNMPAAGVKQQSRKPSARKRWTLRTRKSRRRPRASTRTSEALPIQLAHCLFVVPCSGSKQPGGASGFGAFVTESLPRRLAVELTDRRNRNADEALVDETEILPAVERYDGYLYRAGRAAIEALSNQGSSVLILSGGYGVVLPDERIGFYNCEFRSRMWPDRLIERCLAAFAEKSGVTQVVGVLSATTEYAKVFRRVEWPKSVERVDLLTPESVTGAMVKAPRAQGEALAVIAETGSLPAGWESTDGLTMEVEHTHAD